MTQASNYTQETAPTLYLEAAGTRWAYRSFGKATGTPLVMLIHFVATMDDWDPALVNPLAETHHIIQFDNKGVGGTSGVTPSTIEEMADDAAAFIRALDCGKVDVLGFSIGGFIAQLLTARHPGLVRKLILAGTGPKGGALIADILKHVEEAQAEDPENPRRALFFPKTPAGREAAEAYARRVAGRVKDRVPFPDKAAIMAQAQAITRYGQETLDIRLLESISQPTLIVNGDHDTMVATEGSLDLVRHIPDSKLVIWSGAGHGGLYQFAADFVEEINRFL